ncbi:MAG: DUF2306 domain-containing protein [Kangiellaceae bacterium]|nr:DUF2306 domain-containing protein [Kangiellaceae bacterium]
MQKSINIKPLKSFLAKSAFITIVIGQLIFVLYMLMHYGYRGYTQGLNSLTNTKLPTENGIVPGDSLGNIAFIIHIIIAVIVFVGGPLQFIDRIREKHPKLHHWNGRIYIITGVLTSIAGLYLIWIRGTIGDLSQHISTSFNGILIIAFAYFAITNAVQRKVLKHKQWVFRLFIAYAGVWFIRIMLMAWIAMTNGAGIDWSTFSGPALTAIHFSSYIVPLCILQLYFFSGTKSNNLLDMTLVALFTACIAFMLLGIYAATMSLWLPKILGV